MSSAVALTPLSPLKPHTKLRQNSPSSRASRRHLSTPAFGSRQPRFTNNEIKDNPGPGSYHFEDDRSLIINSPSLSSRGYINAFASKANTYRGSLLEDDTLPYMTHSQSMLEMENSSFLLDPSSSRMKRCPTSSTSSFANSAERTPFNIPPR